MNNTPRFLTLLWIIFTLPAFSLTLHSTVIQNNMAIPKQFTCDGKNISPMIFWDEIPANTKSFALVIKDIDAPAGTWYHWIIVNIPVKMRQLVQKLKIHKPMVVIKNSWGNNYYQGPCPPDGTHRYIFTIYALSKSINVNTNSNLFNVLEQINKNDIAKASFTALYVR